MPILRRGLCRSYPAEHNAYNNARKRCNLKTDRKYPIYGARGIEFRFKSFKEFFELLGEKPSPKHQFDRIDNNGHYEAGNVRWATREENQRNKRNNRLVTYKDKTQTMQDWVDELGIAWSTLRNRLDAGWSVEDAFEKPIDLICSQNSQAAKRPTFQ